MVEAPRANKPTLSEPRAPMLSRADAPNNCKSQIEAKAPTESWVRTVITTSGQCGCSGLTRQKSAFFVSEGSFSGSVRRVLERLSSADGNPGALALATY